MRKIPLDILNQIDWTEQDTTLGKQLNVSRERIRQLRVMFDKPKSANHRKHQDTAFRYLITKLSKEDPAALAELTPQQILQKYPLEKEVSVPIQVVYMALHELGITAKNGQGLGYPTPNWDLPNKILEVIWLRTNLAPTRHLRSGQRAKYRVSNVTKEHQDLIHAELLRAQKFFAENPQPDYEERRQHVLAILGPDAFQLLDPEYRMVRNKIHRAKLEASKKRGYKIAGSFSSRLDDWIAARTGTFTSTDVVQELKAKDQRLVCNLLNKLRKAGLIKGTRSKGKGRIYVYEKA